MTRVTKQERTIQEIVELGKQAIGDLIHDLAATPPDERDEKWHAKNLADATRAAIEIAREERAVLDWEKKHGTGAQSLVQLLTAYLQSMPKTDFDTLMALVQPRAS
jgi:hypothetical protein